MLGWLFGRGERRRPRSRLAGCLLWILALIVLLIIVSLLFGGFRKGTKAAGAGSLPRSFVLVATTTTLLCPGCHNEDKPEGRSD